MWVGIADRYLQGEAVTRQVFEAGRVPLQGRSVSDGASRSRVGRGDLGYGIVQWVASSDAVHCHVLWMRG